MKKTDLSRRKFLGRSGTAALALPLAAAIPAAIEATSPKAVKAASMEDDRQLIPNRVLPSRNIGTGTPVTVANLPLDETSDASVAIQNAIDGLPSGGGTVIIPRHDTDKDSQGNEKPAGAHCVYMLDTQARQDDGGNYCAIKMKSNVRLICKPGVKLQAMTANAGSTQTTRAYMISCHGTSDVEIWNCWLVGERYTHITSGLGQGTDEHFYGISLSGANGVNIRATQVSDCFGDGICIAGGGDIYFSDVLLTGNRRQALSITSGENIYLYDSEFSYTHGTLPMDGIDIEPQGSASVNGVTIENCVIKGNAGCGIQLNAQGTNISNVNVKNCLISYNYWTGFVAQMGNGGSITTGSLFGNAFFQNGSYGLSLIGSTSDYTVGALNEYGQYSNSFADNNNDYTSINYPNTTVADTQGYVSGNDVNVSSGSLSSGTVVRWNTYYTP